MEEYIKQFVNHTAYQAAESSLNKPNVSYCVQENEVHYNNSVDYSKKYLTYEILNDNTSVQITISSDFDTTAISYISYSTDNGNSWTTINNEDNKSSNLTRSFVANRGDYIMWCAEAETLTVYNSENGYINGCKIQCDDEYNILGNIMSLLYGNNFYEECSLEYKDYCFAGLFENEPIVSAENFILPATTLADCCYFNMFRYCTNLITAPELPASTLTYQCYYSMFYGCTNLVTAPEELPATTLADYCYGNMFYGCTNLETAPELSTTTLAFKCCNNMFRNCTNLIVAPLLSATTLAQGCYEWMFSGCTNLEAAPELPATTLTNSCYYGMFYDCTSLNYVKCLATNKLSYDCTINWLTNVAATGTFIKAASMNWTSDASGIPSGWTIQTANE